MRDRDTLAARVAAAQALAAAATPGPYRLEAAATPPGETPWGEVVLRHHSAGGTGTPIPGLRVMWQGRATMGQGRANASLLAAAPDLAALIAELWAEVEALRQGIAPCVDDDGTPFASARYWRAANAEACRRLAESRKTVLELRTERDEARAEAARLRALCATVPTWGEQGAGLGDDLPSTPTEED